jgi:hypothetical protein
MDRIGNQINTYIGRQTDNWSVVLKDFFLFCFGRFRSGKTLCMASKEHLKSLKILHSTNIQKNFYEKFTPGITASVNLFLNLNFKSYDQYRNKIPAHKVDLKKILRFILLNTLCTLSERIRSCTLKQGVRNQPDAPLFCVSAYYLYPFHLHLLC